MRELQTRRLILRPYRPEDWEQIHRHAAIPEAARALIRFGFEDLGLIVVYAQCDRRNAASRRVMEKAGMVADGSVAAYGRQMTRHVSMPAGT